MLLSMRPAERIRTIKEAAESLSTRTTAEIQLVLRQFGLNTYDFEDSWHNDGPTPFEYCINQIEQGSDSDITELHEYLRGDDAAPLGTDSLADPIWRDLPGRVFVSHIHDSREFAGRVKAVLGARYGIDGFVAHDDINPSRRWRETIKAALNSCHVFVALLDDGFHESQWCDQEVGWALARRIPILPVQAVGFDRSTKRDGFLEEQQDVCMDDAGTIQHHVWLSRHIFQSFLAYSQTQEVAAKILVEAFVRSSSFEATRRLWKDIERQPVVESEQLRRLEYAVQTNRQVYEAVSDPPGPRRIPELVKELVTKFEPPPVYEEPF